MQITIHIPQQIGEREHNNFHGEKLGTANTTTLY